MSTLRKRPLQRALSTKKRPRGLQRLRSFSDGLAYAHSKAYAKVCGPEWIRTLRGQLLGRRVALVVCGEAHEDVLDLTRKSCIIEPEKGWRKLSEPGTLGAPLATKDCRSLKGAKAWASRTVDEAEDSEEDDLIGAKFIYQGGEEPQSAGTARVFRPSQPWHRHSPHLRPHRSPRLGPQPSPPAESSKLHVFEWSDLDKEADDFNKRRLSGEEVSAKELDALISERKKARQAEGLELFDDWLLRQAGDLKPGRRLEVVLEAHVPAREVELHQEPSYGPPPLPHECLRTMELDSDADSEDERDPDDGQGTYLDYLRRRCLEAIPGSVHAMDPRELGDDDHEDLRDAFQGLLSEPLPPDPELVELEKPGLEEAAEDVAVVPSRKARRASRRPQPVPSWEAFFGATAELLYYSPHVKADFVPILMSCIAPPETTSAGGPQALKDFFAALFFDTVPKALGRLNLEGERRSLTYLRSLTYHKDGTLTRRPADGGLVPVRAAPVERYLKAKSSDPPRTWISGLAESLRQRGATEIVRVAQEWYLASVSHLLEDPKTADDDGDYFVAWLRECHREVYDDVDRADPKELRSMKKVRSTKDKSKRHNLANIRIPNMEEAFRELGDFDPKKGSSRRQRVLAKILIDAFQLRLVDLAAILRVADCVLSAREDEEVVVVLYAGGAHAHCVEEFWRAQSFTSDDLPKRGLVGKDDWEDDEPRGLVLPKYLHDFDLLFPKEQVEEAVPEGADEDDERSAASYTGVAGKLKA